MQRRDGQEPGPAARARSTGMVSPNWVSTETGVRFDERYFMDPVHRWQENRRVAAWQASFNDALRRRVARYTVDWEPVGISGIGGVFDNRSVETYTVGLPQTFVLVTAMYGGRIVYFDADNPDVDGNPLADVERPGQIVLPDVATSWPVDVYLQQFEQLVAAHGRERVTLLVDIDDVTGMPLWYLHSPLTTAYRLRGQQLFLDMEDDPELAGAILDAAMDTGWQLYRLHAAQVGRQVRLLPLATCIASLVSPAVYQAWEIPRIRTLIGDYGAARIHSCGPSSHILDALSTIPGIVEMEVGAGTDIARTRHLFPSATINYLVDTPKWVSYTADRAYDEIARAVAESGDGPFTALWPVETGTSLDAIEAIYAAVGERNARAAARA